MNTDGFNIKYTFLLVFCVMNLLNNSKINAIPSSDWIFFTKTPVATFYSVSAASDGSFGIFFLHSMRS